MKKFLLLAALACGSLSAMAQTLGVSGTLVNGEGSFAITGTDLNSQSAVQFNVYFPEGLSIECHYDDDEEDDVYAISKGVLQREDHVMSYNLQKDGSMMFLIYNGNAKKFYSNTKGTSLVNLTLKATSSYTGGDITIKAIQFSTEGSSVLKDDVAANDINVKMSTKATGTNYYVSTIASPFDITLPEGVSASEGKNMDSYVYLDESATTSTVSMGKPAFLLSSSAVDAHCYGVPATTESNGAILTAGYSVKEVSVGSLVLSGGTLKTLTKTVTNFPAYKAFISSDLGVKGMMIGDVETSLDAIIADEDATIYNVQGMRLNKTQKGLNIINGKKVMVK